MLGGGDQFRHGPVNLRGPFRQALPQHPHAVDVLVKANAAPDGAEVPRAYVKDGKIVLNLSEGATQHLRLGNEEVEFDARFAGVVHHVRFPVSAVLGVYARETGEGMVFSEQDLGPEPPKHPTPAEEGGTRRPQLKIVK